MMNKVLPLLLSGLLVSSCSWFRGGEGDSGPATGSGFNQDLRPRAKTMVYECNGYEFIARLGPGEMALWLEDRYVILSQARSASGVRYEEGDTVFWLKGQDAFLSIDGQRYSGCRLAEHRVPWEDARRRGVSFRAVGNEPGWYLEIQQGRQLLFVEQYGMKRVLIPGFSLEEGSGWQKYLGTAGSNTIEVHIVEQACSDSMSGQRYTSQVTVSHNGVPFKGCGRALDYPWK